MIGHKLDNRYEVSEYFRSDGAARWYRALRVGTNESVQVGVVHDHFARSTRFASALQECAARVQKLVDPGVLRLIEVVRGERAGRAVVALVAESFEGRNVCEVVRERGVLPSAQVTLIVLRVLDALAAAHEVGIYHLDLKPEDILTGATPDGTPCVKLSGFGVGMLASREAPRLSLGGTALGTARYGSPELIRDGQGDGRSDLYSMGVILYELLTATPLFGGQSSLAQARMHLEAEPEPLRLRSPEQSIDAGVESVVLRALRKDPAERFASAREMSTALAEARKATAPEGSPRAAGRCRGARRLAWPGYRDDASQRAGRAVVGRDDLLDLVRSAAVAPAEDPHSRGKVVILLGGAGMGKSAIVDEVAAELWGGPVGIGRVDGRRSLCTPLEPFTDAARDLLEVPRGCGLEQQRAAEEYLRARMRLSDDEIVRLLDRVSGQSSRLAVGPEIAEREQTSALRAFFGRLVGLLPTVLIVEDADALDPASLALVRDLLEVSATQALSVIVTARADPWPEWNASNAIRASVSALDDDSARRMLGECLGDMHVPADTLASAAAWARGWPLVLSACAAAKRTWAKDHEIGAELKGPLEPSGARRMLVEAVLRGLNKQAHGWMRCAALAGSRAPIAMLEAWTASQQDRQALLDVCLATSLVKVEGDNLSFRNEAMRSIVADLVTERARNEMHRFIANWLSEGSPSRAPLEVVAEHWEAAGEHEQAAATFEQAGTELLERNEPRAAASLFKRAGIARQLAQDDAGAIRAGLAKVNALVRVGDGQAAGDVLARLERLGSVGAHGLRARAAALVAQSRGDPELAVRTLVRAVESCGDGMSELEEFDVRCDLAKLLQELNRLDEAQTQAVRAHDLAVTILEAGRSRATGLTDTTRVSQAASLLARVTASLGRFDAAMAVLQRALQLVASRDDEASASRVLANLAFVESCQEHTAQACELAEKALALACKTGDREAAARIALSAGSHNLKLGRAAEAAKTLEFARTLARSVGWMEGLAIAQKALAKMREPPPSAS